MAFVKDMATVQKQLEKLGHTASIPVGTEPHLKDETFVDSLEANLQFCISEDVMRKNFKEVTNNDAVLVLNKKRNNIDGYIGVSALLEMGIAHFHGKKIFLYNTPPDYHEVRWAHEVAIMQPVILNGDLKKIR